MPNSAKRKLGEAKYILGCDLNPGMFTHDHSAFALFRQYDDGRLKMLKMWRHKIPLWLRLAVRLGFIVAVAER